jgi:large subunit ribosomal protein L6
MHEFQLPKGVNAKVSEDGSEITISGKLGSTTKTVNTMLLTAKVEGERVVLEDAANKKLAKMADLAGNSLCSELKSAAQGVEKGVERKMKVVYAHFPMTVEVKGKEVHVKNIFGEKYPRVARIIGDTKVEVKGQDIQVKGVDEYDVGQTTANITKLSGARRKDSRVFQDGIYVVREE